MLWKIKSWVKTEIPWDWLLLKAATCVYVGSLWSLLPVRKLLKSGGRFLFCWFSSLDPPSKSDASECAGSQQRPPLLTRSQGVRGALRWNLSGSGQSPLGAGAWAEIIDVMHCHLLCLFSHCRAKLTPGRHGAWNKTITACHSQWASGGDCIRVWRTDTMHKWIQKAYIAAKGPKFCAAKRLSIFFLFENKGLKCTRTVMSKRIYKLEQSSVS